MARKKQNKRNPFGKGLTKKDREERAATTNQAATASVGAHGRTRPLPSSATVTPNTARATKRARARAPGASPRGSTNSQNIDVFSWGTTSLRSSPQRNPQRRLFDGAISVQGGSPTSRRHTGVAVRSRTPFGELSKSQKAATFKEIIQFTGKDVLSFIEYACRSATTDLKTESMQVGVSTPKIFKERVADIMADVLPKTQVHECTVPKALAIKADCFMSDGSYVMMRAHHPKFYPPLARLKEEARRTEPRLAPLLDENEQVLGYYCTNIWADLIVPEINEYIKYCKRKRIPLPTTIRYKAGGDGHTITRFNKEAMPHEQMCLSLLLPGRKHNSVRNVIPLANSLDEKESYNLLEIMNKAVDPQLPRGERWIMGHKFFFEDFRMGDRSYLSFENGHSGVHVW